MVEDRTARLKTQRKSLKVDIETSHVRMTDTFIDFEQRIIALGFGSRL